MEGRLFGHRKVIETYDIGVFTICNWREWGHTIDDFISGLTYLPESVQKQEFTIAIPPSAGKDLQDWLQACGFKVHLFDGYANQHIFVRQLYVVSHMSKAHRAFAGGYSYMRRKMFERFNLSQINSTRFCAMNRDTRRYLGNFNEVVDGLNKYVKIDDGKTWEVIHNQHNIYEQVKLWPTIKVLFTVGGSQLFNCMFMHNSTGLIVLFPNNVLTEQMSIAFQNHMFSAVIYHKDWKFLDYDPYNCSVDRVVFHAKQVVAAVKYQKWQSKEGLRNLFENVTHETCPDNKFNPMLVDYFIDQTLDFGPPRNLFA